MPTTPVDSPKLYAICWNMIEQYCHFTNHVNSVVTKLLGQQPCNSMWYFTYACTSARDGLPHTCTCVIFLPEVQELASSSILDVICWGVPAVGTTRREHETFVCEVLLLHRYHCDQSTSFWPLKKILFQYTKNTMFFRVKISKLKINFQFRLSWLMFIKLTEWCTWMLGNMKLISRVVQDIWLVRFVHSWDILSNTWNKFHISAQPRIILFIFQSFGKFIRALELLS